MRILNSFLVLSRTQFKAIYIFWTLLMLFYDGIIIYTTYETFYILLTNGFEFKTFPVFHITIALLSILIPLNLVLFYLAMFFQNRNVILILRWLPIGVLILFIYFIIVLSDNYIVTDFVWMFLFIVSYSIVWIKQNAYFQLIKTRKSQ